MSMRYIYVIEAGWVLTGFDASITSNEVRIENSACIRRWGTAEGLGQLALKGPTGETVLDFCGTTRINPRHVLFRIECPGWP